MVNRVQAAEQQVLPETGWVVVFSEFLVSVCVYEDRNAVGPS